MSYAYARHGSVIAEEKRESDGGVAGTLVVLFLLAAFAFPLLLFFCADNNDAPTAEANRKTSSVNWQIEPTDEKISQKSATISKVDGERIPPSDEQPIGSVGGLLTNDETRSEAVTVKNQWRCACETGFLPPGMLGQSLGGAEAVLRMSTGRCYHKKNEI